MRTYEQFGVPLNRCSRLGKQIDVYLDEKGTLPQVLEPEHELFDTAVEANRDLNQIAFALMQLAPRIPREEMGARLRKLLVDNVLPQDDPDHSPGRDAQCELFVAGLCVKAGFEPVFNESPDIRCNLASQTIGVAVKRIKAPPERFNRRFEQRVREASRQIVNSGLPGVIVADISRSFNPTNWRVPLEVSDSKFDFAWGADTNRLIDRYTPQLLEWTRAKPVRGIILIDHVVRCHQTEGWRMELSGRSLNLCPFNERRRREFQEFDRRFMGAVCSPDQPGDSNDPAIG
jgi:hypothetical protein